VISELVKTKPNPRVAKWVRSQDEENLFLSVITIGEIQKGISKLPHVRENRDGVVRLDFWWYVGEKLSGLEEYDAEPALDWMPQGLCIMSLCEESKSGCEQGSRTDCDWIGTAAWCCFSRGCQAGRCFDLGHLKDHQTGALLEQPAR